LIDYYEPEIVNATDYYPFGMPSRVASGKYRFGFNGKMNDNEVKGFGLQQDYGFRIYDPRVGRFLTVDPLTAEYPELTPYQFASNTPVWAIDIDGLEGRPAGMGNGYTRTGRGGMRVVSEVEVMARNTGIRARDGQRILNQ
jgi:RHS repeat-associated protein